jgi:parallel beta-helix repeat protein
MNRRLVSLFALTVLLASALSTLLRAQKIEASGTIYIRADGSIDPTTAPITSIGNVTYTFTDDIYSGADGIVIERDNIILDGAKYTLQGIGGGNGIDLSNRHNVTIADMGIRQFGTGLLDAFSYGNVLLRNNISANSYMGIRVHWSSDNVLRNNTVHNNKYNVGIYGDYYSHFRNDVDSSNLVDGKPVYYWIGKADISVPLDAGYVALYNCQRIDVQNLNLCNNGQGILLYNTEDSTILGNNIASNVNGIQLYFSWNNIVSENNVTDSEGDSGVNLYESSFNNVSRNHIINNGNGIIVRSSSENNSIYENSIALNDWTGISVQYDSVYNAISKNNITENEYGMILNGNSNQVFENYVSLNNDYGVELSSASGNVLRKNSITDNKRGFKVFGVSLSDFVNDIDTSNTVNGKPIYYWVSRQDAIVPIDAGFLALINCTGITIQNLNMSNNWQGVFLGYTNTSRIIGSSLADNNVGIELRFSFANIITEDEFRNNTDCGISLYQSAANRIEYNVIANNYVGVDPLESSNNIFAHNQFLSNNL